MHSTHDPDGEGGSVPFGGAPPGVAGDSPGLSRRLARRRPGPLDEAVGPGTSRPSAEREGPRGGEPGGPAGRPDLGPGDDPFAVPIAWRDPLRRWRGRLAQPVTVWTAGRPGAAAGLTVSSLLVADDPTGVDEEGASGTVLGLLGADSLVVEAIGETGAAVVHVLTEAQRALAMRFSGERPEPGGPFAGLEVETTPHGPRLVDVETWLGGPVTWTAEVGGAALLALAPATVVIGPPRPPLCHFHGHYRRLAAER